MFSASSLFLFGTATRFRVPDAVQRFFSGAPQSRDPSRSSQIELICQIPPIRIEFLDQFDLPGSPPALHRMFSRAGFKNGVERFEINEQIDAVFSGETGDEFGFVLGDAAGEIIGDADVQSSVSLACEDADEEGRVHAALPDVGIVWA